MISRHINFDEKFETNGSEVFASADEYFAEQERKEKELEWQEYCYLFWDSFQEREENINNASIEIAQGQSEEVYHAEG